MKLTTNAFQFIAFDADDTLWENETFFREVEHQFYKLIDEFCTKEQLEKELYQTEIANLPIYGFGIKGFMLSMIETALRVSSNQVSPDVLEQIIKLGQRQLQEPIVLLPAVQRILEQLYPHYRLVLATKGDLVDQKRKVELSGLKKFFCHVEIMTDKTPDDYAALLKHLDCHPSQFLMVGNSIKSDVLPVLELGAYAAHIPFHTTWSHEVVHEPIVHPHLLKASKMEDLLAHLL